MDYKEKYEKALERAGEILGCGPFGKSSIKYIFPELKESEDERIRKWLIDTIKAVPNDSIEWEKIDKSDVLDWLEKQDKAKESLISQHENKTCEEDSKSSIIEDERIRKALISVLTSDFEEDTTIDDITVGEIVDWLEKQDETDETKAKRYLMNKGYPIDANGIFPTYEEMYNIIRDGIEKQGEKKELNKVEPKFNEGDWIVWQDKCYVVNYKGCGYELIDQNGLRILLGYETIDKDAHLWTIKDAKDGDVLANDTIVLIVNHLGTFENTPIIYSWYFADSKKFYGMGTSKPDRWEAKGFTPATKEKRASLFQKMTEADYEWDAEKKELKKIEQAYTAGKTTRAKQIKEK